MTEGKLLSGARLSVAAVLIKGTTEMRFQEKKREKNTTKRKQWQCESEALSASLFPREACVSCAREIPNNVTKVGLGARTGRRSLPHTEKTRGETAASKAWTVQVPLKGSTRGAHIVCFSIFFISQLIFHVFKIQPNLRSFNSPFFFCIHLLST